MSDPTVTLWILRARESGVFELWQQGDLIDEADWVETFNDALDGVQRQTDLIITSGSGASTSLTAQALSGQPNLQVASTALFTVGESIQVGLGATAESHVIATITDATHMATVANLANTQAIGKPVSRSPVELVEARNGFTTLDKRLDNMERWLNVKAYGAKGDGVVDDTAAIQAAIDAATTPGQTVFFPYTAAGYKITSLLNVTARPLMLIGESGFNKGTKITQATANLGVFNMTALADGSHLRHLYLLGTGAQTTSRGIYSLKTANLYDVRVEGFYDGVYFDNGAFYSSVDNCMFYLNANAGLRLQGTYNTTLHNTRLHSNAYGIYAAGFSGLRVFAGAVEQNTVQGLHLEGTSSAVLISGTYFESAVGNADINVGSTGAVSGVVIHGCLFIANTVASFWHINAGNVDHMTVSGCDIRAAGAGGGSITSTATDLILMSNKIAGTVTATGVGTQVGGLVLGSANLYNVGTDTIKSDDSLWLVKGVRTFTKAGTPVDGDFPGSFVGDGILVVDTTANKIWTRIGGVWKSVTVA